MSKTIREELKDMYLAEGGQQGDLTNDSQTIAGMVKAINTNRANTLKPLTVAKVAQDKDFWGTAASQIQADDVVVSGDQITGTLYEYTDKNSALVTQWGPGYFVGLKFTGLDDSATSVKVGLEPSQGSGLVEIINDPDKDGVFKINEKASKAQLFKVVQSDGVHELTQVFSLAGLTLTPAN